MIKALPLNTPPTVASQTGSTTARQPVEDGRAAECAGHLAGAVVVTGAPPGPSGRSGSAGCRSVPVVPPERACSFLARLFRLVESPGLEEQSQTSILPRMLLRMPWRTSPHGWCHYDELFQAPLAFFCHGDDAANLSDMVFYISKYIYFSNLSINNTNKAVHPIRPPPPCWWQAKQFPTMVPLGCHAHCYHIPFCHHIGYRDAMFMHIGMHKWNPVRPFL